jgi:uncharacterized protein (DUF302 family)
MSRATRRTSIRVALAAMVGMGTAAAAVAGIEATAGNGIVKVRSVYPLSESIERVKRDIAGKGIMFFDAIDQSKLAAAAGITLRPSTLLIFGNPPLGVQFITSNPSAGLDWPVRLLLTQDPDGTVWAEYTDFRWIARRHGITDRDAAFNKATEVIASITSSIATK